MIYAIGLLISGILWLFTLKRIIELNKAIPIKIAFVVGILVFPFFGVLYPIYYFAKKEMNK